MSSKPHKYWPSPGSTWSHWSGLLLATRLATVRAGFTSVGRNWDLRMPDTLKVRCMAEPNGRRAGRCRSPILVAEAVEAGQQDGAWRVVRLESAALDAQRHPEHQGGLGLSFWLKEKPTSPLLVEPDMRIADWRELHTLEGAIMANARCEGRFVHASIEATSATTYTLTCCLGPSRCPFIVRLRQIDPDDGVEYGWKVIEVFSQHTCLTSAAAPQKRLLWRMNFFTFHHPLDLFLGAYPLKETATKTEREEASKVSQAMVRRVDKMRRKMQVRKQDGKQEKKVQEGKKEERTADTSDDELEPETSFVTDEAGEGSSRVIIVIDSD